MPKVRKFDTGLAGQGSDKPSPAVSENTVPDIAPEVAASASASAPVKIRARPGNPRARRYKQKTYSLLQEDIDLIEELVAEIRQGGLYERGRSDVVRAGVRLLKSLSRDDRLKAVQAVQSLKG